MRGKNEKAMTERHFPSEFRLAVIPVNCRGVAGCGVALQCKQRYPEWFHMYWACCRDGALWLGHPLLHGGLVPGSSVPPQRAIGGSLRCWWISRQVWLDWWACASGEASSVWQCRSWDVARAAWIGKW